MYKTVLGSRTPVIENQNMDPSPQSSVGMATSGLLLNLSMDCLQRNIYMEANVVKTIATVPQIGKLQLHVTVMRLTA